MTNDYISRDAAIQTACVGCQYNFPDLPCSATDCVIKGRVVNIPAADVAPVVHARWYLNEDRKWACTNCDGLAIQHPDEPDKWQALTDYCPNCGAKMDGDGNG